MPGSVTAEATPNPFDTFRVAEGYSKWRPRVHPYVIERVRDRLGIAIPVKRALDVGCGAGLSTTPLMGIAREIIGVEPFEMMLRFAPVRDAHFAAAAAEALPVRSHSINVITAAGSLNWADLGRFFPEAERVLAPGGTLVIYDFGQGSDFDHSPHLAEWHDEFKRRYPSPPCLKIDPPALDLNAYGLELTHHETFEVAREMTPDFYLEYAMTETNVADAVSRGVPECEIRDWCEQELRPVFRGVPQQVVFRGYIAFIERSVRGA